MAVELLQKPYCTICNVSGHHTNKSNKKGNDEVRVKMLHICSVFMFLFAFLFPGWNTNMVFQIDDGAKINLISKHLIPKNVKINTNESIELRDIFDDFGTFQTLGYIYIPLKIGDRTAEYDHQVFPSGPI